MIQYDHQVKVYYKDVDQMGIVYYSRYFEYFEQARTELLVFLGLDVSSIEENGIQLPVISGHCDYHLGARFEQQLIIRTMVNDLPKAKLRIEYEVFVKGNDTESLVSGYTVHAFINRKGKPIRAPKTVIEKLKDKFNLAG